MDDPKALDPDRLAAEYDALRHELKRLLSAPNKDMAAVAKVIDRLDAVHLAFKEAHGLHGNNPND
jgi:hypothetical protein